MKQSPAIERAKQRLLQLKKVEAKRLTALAPCSFCKQPTGKPCVKIPSRTPAHYPHVERREAAANGSAQLPSERKT
jgi:hypothetical protein